MIKPVEDKVLIKPIKEEKVSSFGLVLASTKDETPTEGFVVAMGPGIVFENGQRLIMDIEVGDKVAYSKFAGTEVEHEGESFTILPYRDILAVI